jgi:hypothetical protein
VIVEIFQIVSGEPMPEEGDSIEELNQFIASPPTPVPPKKKMKKGREECEMLEKAFTILTSAAAAAASSDDECRSFGNFIANKLRNYSSRTRNIVQHEISSLIFAADQGRFDVSCPVPTPSPASQVSSPTTPSSASVSEEGFVHVCL